MNKLKKLGVFISGLLLAGSAALVNSTPAQAHCHRGWGWGGGHCHHWGGWGGGWRTGYAPYGYGGYGGYYAPPVAYYGNPYYRPRLSLRQSLWGLGL